MPGKKWEKKVAEVRAEMIKAGADLLVVTAMDEVAWLLNLRGSDVPTTPGQLQGHCLTSSFTQTLPMQLGKHHKSVQYCQLFSGQSFKLFD